MSTFFGHLTRALLGPLVAVVLVSLVSGGPSGGLATAANRIPIEEAAGAPIDSGLLAKADSGTLARAWILMRARADLSPAASIPDWTRRGTWVYETLRATAERSQAGVRTMLAARGVAGRPFFIVNGIAVDRPDSATLRAAAALPGVAAVVADPTFRIVDPVGGILRTSLRGAGGGGGVEWGVNAIGAPTVWSTYADRGQGITVATIDTGVLFTHSALVAQYRGTLGGGSFSHDYDWYDPSGGCPNAPCDTNGHGTHTMGTIVGDDGTNRIGVAPGARWIAARGCVSSGCSSTDLVAAGQWMLAPTDLTGKNARADLRPQIVSNSWGSSSGSDTFYRQTVQAWVASGILPVFANGNAGPGCGTVGAPGSYPEAYGVGAYDSSNQIAGFSSRGASPFSSTVKPDISAPGVDVTSSYNDGSFATLSGTSMATPHVAGAAALVLAAAPSLVGDVSGLRNVLDGGAVATSDTSCGGTASDNNVWGRGRLSASASVAAAPRTNAGTLTGLVSSGGTPVVGATVLVTGSASRALTTDASGRYSVVLATGSYSIAVNRFGYVDASRGSLAVANGGTTSADVTLTAAPSYTVRGTLVDGTGAAVAGATVSLAAPIAPVVTDAAGAYTFVSVPAGTYAYTATPADTCLLPSSGSLSVPLATSANTTLASRKDAAGHVCSTGAFTFQPGSTKLALAGDDVTASVTLPFKFPYYGTSYSTLYLSTNGFASVVSLSNAYYLNGTLPSTANPNGALMPFWDDLFVDGSAAIYTATTGSVGSRSFIVEWRNVRPYTQSTTSERMTFGLILKETGEIVFEYGSLAATGTARGAGATIGIEKRDGKDAFQYAYGSAALAPGWAIRFR